jgi:uncharacterized protein YdhG (YjbR/CyaY superfamily)
MKKTTSIPKNIDEYLADVPEPARGALQKIRAAIRSAVPTEATEAITYRIPTFKYNGALVAFAAFSYHCSFFPMSYAVIGAFKNELKRFEVSKGTIRFPVDKPLPSTLVKKMVKARIAENEGRKRR